MLKRIGMLMLCAAVAGACSAKALPHNGTLSAAAADPNAEAIVADASSVMQALTGYRVRSVVTTRTAKGPVVVMVDASFERPGRVSTVTTIGSRSIASITIDRATWVRNSAGAWVRTPSSAAPSLPAASPFSFLSSVTSATVLRHEAIGGVDAYVVEGKVPLRLLSTAFGAEPATAASARVTMWIDVTTHRILRLTEMDAQPFTVAAAISEFDAHFGIAAPK